jgi:hypothetical protein
MKTFYFTIPAPSTAFAEYVRHYADLEHEFAETDKGVRMTVKGRTATATKVAQNHAKIISAFAGRT